MTTYRDERSPYYTYEFQFRGKRYKGSTACTTKRDADQFERNERRRVALGEDQKEQLMFDQAGGLWWEARGLHHANQATEKGQLKRLSKFFGATKMLDDIDMLEAQRYVARRRADVSDSTVNREIELLRRVVRYIASLKRFELPDLDWSALLLDEPQERVRELTADEEAALFAELDEDLGAVAEFAMLSGQRRTSVITLLWNKVDFANREATVRVKGNKWHTFPLSTRMLAIIANRPKIGPRVFTYECKRTAPIRPGRPKRIKGHRYPFSKQGWTRQWRKALKDAGIEDFRFHDLRHTAATRLVRTSGNLKAAKELLGHTEIATTARYAHVTRNDLRKLMEAAESPNSPRQEEAESAETRRKA